MIREGFFIETDRYFTVPGILHACSCSFDWNNFAVHNFHFEPRFIERTCIVYRDGTKLEASLNNSRLSEDAIPSIFPPATPLKIQTRNQLSCRTNYAKCSCFKNRHEQRIARLLRWRTKSEQRLKQKQRGLNAEYLVARKICSISDCFKFSLQLFSYA